MNRSNWRKAAALVTQHKQEAAMAEMDQLSSMPHLSLALSVEDFFTSTLHHGGPHSMVGLACALEWLSAM